MNSILLFATELYALPILRPLDRAARAAGMRTAWIVPDSIAAHLQADEYRIRSRREAKRSGADAVFCAANWVWPALPGVKVQVFHGFNARKRSSERGHFRLRGFFDLYCTQGPDTTRPFQELAQQHGYFAVKETGWPKLDPLFQVSDAPSSLFPGRQRPVVMYASTFTHGLSSALEMLEPLQQLIARDTYDWLLTLHPKCDPGLMAHYRQLEADNARFLTSERLLAMLQRADVLVSDTSSVIDEFAVQLKPVVTLNNREPQPFMLNVQTPQQVPEAVDQALAMAPELRARITAHADRIHPYRDGHSSARVLAATTRLMAGDFALRKRKPWNVWRRQQTRQRIKLLLPRR